MMIVMGGVDGEGGDSTAEKALAAPLGHRGDKGHFTVRTRLDRFGAVLYESTSFSRVSNVDPWKEGISKPCGIFSKAPSISSNISYCFSYLTNILLKCTRANG